MVFIDGGHSLEAAQTDYESWSGFIVGGGILAIHDIFPDPEMGGQAPFTIWKQAIESGLFEDLGIVRTLGILRRTGTGIAIGSVLLMLMMYEITTTFRWPPNETPWLALSGAMAVGIVFVAIPAVTVRYCPWIGNRWRLGWT